MDPFLSPKPYLNSSAKRGMLIVLLDDSTTNRLFRNSMERIGYGIIKGFSSEAFIQSLLH